MGGKQKKLDWEKKKKKKRTKPEEVRERNPNESAAAERWLVCLIGLEKKPRPTRRMARHVALIGSDCSFSHYAQSLNASRYIFDDATQSDTHTVVVGCNTIR